MKIVKLFFILILSNFYLSQLNAMAAQQEMPYDVSVRIHNKSNQVLGAFFGAAYGPAKQAVIKLNPGQTSKRITLSAYDFTEFDHEYDGYIETIKLKFQPLSSAGLKETYLGKLPGELKKELSQYWQVDEVSVILVKSLSRVFAVVARKGDQIIFAEHTERFAAREKIHVLVDIYVNGPVITDLEVDLTAKTTPID